jgi:tetratricopeptide (TPR) repeat protein
MQALALALLVVSATGAAGSGAGPPARDGAAEARAHFRRGAALFERARYREAAREFEAARRLRPHGHVSYNLARCRERLGDTAGALHAYREYLRAMPEAKDRRAVRAAIARLEARLGAAGVQQLRVATEPAAAEVYVDGRLRGRTPLAATLALGAHQVSLVKEGYATARRDAVLTARRSVEIEVALSPASAGSPEPLAGPSAAASGAAAGPAAGPSVARQAAGGAVPAELAPVAAPAAPTVDLRAQGAPAVKPRPRRWTWVAAGVAAAALAAGIAYGIAASNASGELRAREHDGATAQRLAATAASRSRTANVLYGVAAGAGAAGLTLFFVEGRF